jgi:hypothetical protein
MYSEFLSSDKCIATSEIREKVAILPWVRLRGAWEVWKGKERNLMTKRELRS